MPKPVNTYACKDVIVAFGGRRLTGFGPDAFISIAPSGEGTIKEVGADREVVRSLDPDGTFTITSTMQQTSDDIGYLQRTYELDRETGRGVLPILITDLMGGHVFSAMQAWVANFPEHGYARNAGTREFTIDTGDGNHTA